MVPRGRSWIPVSAAQTWKPAPGSALRHPGEAFQRGGASAGARGGEADAYPAAGRDFGRDSDGAGQTGMFARQQAG